MASQGGFGRPADVPWWVGLVLIPALNLTAALLISGVVVLIIGEDPLAAMDALLFGAFGAPDLIGLTLYYTTNFVFAGLAVAIAFHCGLFNIGGDGQAYMAGLGVALVALSMGGWPWWTVLPVAILVSGLFGAAWAFLPGWLQAYRGSHIVITTIMFNFIAASVMNYLLVDVMIAPGQQSPETVQFDPSTWVPTMQQAAGWFGLPLARSYLNLSFLWAIVCCVLFWVFVWHTRWGYEIRTVGQNERAAVYAGISPAKAIVLAMCLSGMFAGFVPLNEILGVQHRLILNFTGGVGFVGIAVALMGRNHPVGIFLSALLFGALYQGGSELSFEYPTINREMVVVIQGLIILFAGALENLFRPQIEALFRRRGREGAPAAG
jgi:ABC-type uncharacterized transport system permease subunit